VELERVRAHERAPSHATAIRGIVRVTRPAGRAIQPAGQARLRPLPEVVPLASTFERVRSIIAERLGVEEEKITMEAEFVADLNADSLDLVEVIMAMEQEFDLEIKDDDAEAIKSVGDAVRFIEENGK
jgi:acyl carrier protein